MSDFDTADYGLHAGEDSVEKYNQTISAATKSAIDELKLTLPVDLKALILADLSMARMKVPIS